MHDAITIAESALGYRGRTVLRDVKMTIAPGERVAILGRSGAGKSTLLNYIYGCCRPDAALVPQAASLVGALSVFHNVFMGQLERHSTLFNLRTLLCPGTREKEDIGRILDLLGLREKMFDPAGSLSGGQQQRTSIARAIYNARPIIVGDEPVSALDRLQGESLLCCLKERARTLVLAMHDVPLALAHSTRIVMLHAGRVALDVPSSGVRAADLAMYYDVGAR